MLNVETQSRGSERTGICQRQLDGYYVRLVNSALNGEPFIYTRKGKEYNVLGELGKVGREYAKGGDDEKARTISNFLKMRELADNLEVTNMLAKNYRGKIIVDKKGNKRGVGFKVNEGGHPVDSYGRPIDLTRVEKLYFPGVDYSSKIDNELKKGGEYAKFNVTDKESRLNVRKEIWKSSTKTKAINFYSDGGNEIVKGSLKRVDFGKAEEKFYSAAREFETLGNKELSTLLYGQALVCRTMKEGNYESTLNTLKDMRNRLYAGDFLESINKNDLKTLETLLEISDSFIKKDEPDKKKPDVEREGGYKIEDVLKDIGVPEGKEALNKYADKLAEEIEAVLKGKVEKKEKYAKPEEVGLPEKPYVEKEKVKKEKPAFLDFKRSEAVRLGKGIGSGISNVYKAAVSGEGKEPWETEIVKKAVSPFKKGYQGYRSFIDKVVIGGGDRLGEKLYKGLRKEEKVKKEKPAFLDFKRSEAVRLGKGIGSGISNVYKGIVSKEGNPLETEIVKKAVSPFKKGYQFYKGLIDKGIEKGDRLGEKIGVKI